MMDVDRVFRDIRRMVEERRGPLRWRRRDPFFVLISTIISQRTRDETTRAVSERLFSRFGDPEALASAPLEELEEVLKPAGFYRQKARRIREVAKAILDNGGRVPDTLDGLLKLPSVGRKTANCVLVFAYGKPAIPVDTHVHRISNRLGLVDTKTPEETERELEKVLDRRYWLELNPLFVSFGQTVCLPRNPRCGVCRLRDVCKYHINRAGVES